MRGSDWKFAHHSLKANAVQVLGPVVPQNVGGAVRAGCTPVLDLCHLLRRRHEMRNTTRVNHLEPSQLPEVAKVQSYIGSSHWSFGNRNAFCYFYVVHWWKVLR